jgi:YVTN family beta-propeller protein
MASFPRTLHPKWPKWPTWRAWRAWRVCPPALLAIGTLTGCPANGEDLQPPRDELVFPTALAVSPDGSRLFAVNANSDLRWSSGSVVAFDLAGIEDLASRWLALPVEERGCQGQGGPLAGEPCSCDLDDPTILACDQAAVADPDAGVRVGNFATDVAVQDLGGGDLRLFIPVRGDPSVTWVDYRDGALACDGTSEGFPLCDEERILGYEDDPTRELIDEPFGVFVDSAGEYAVITHLQRGAVSLIDAPRDGTPVLVDALANLFAADALGIQAAIGVAGRRLADPSPDDADLPETLLYVTSRTEDRVQMLAVAPPRGSVPAQLVPAGFFFLNDVQPSNDSRDIEFSADGTRAFMINRNPPMLHVMDTAPTPEGVPANQIIASVELCRDPANLTVAEPGEGTRVYVACFPEGQVWAIDPEAGQVEAIIPVGSGPHALVADPTRQRLYVGNFLDHSLAVIDLDPVSPARNRVVLRLRSSQNEGDN